MNQLDPIENDPFFIKPLSWESIYGALSDLFQCNRLWKNL